mmetsp:Transcript_135405/g.239525  ORF Transcript_135405/g.239525 Transcript_135405/m.239525 type:complete len:167 (-) Transcript_135405:57-557(-)
MASDAGQDQALLQPKMKEPRTSDEEPLTKSKKSSRAKTSLVLPPSKLAKHWHRARIFLKMSPLHQVVATSFVEHMMKDVIIKAAFAAQSLNQKRITPRAIQLAVLRDPDLAKLFGDSHFRSTRFVHKPVPEYQKVHEEEMASRAKTARKRKRDLNMDDEYMSMKTA